MKRPTLWGGALLGSCLVGVVAYGHVPPPLTEQRIIEDLGSDELVLRFYAVEEKFVAEFSATYECRDATELDDEAHAAEAAGWTERICKDDPTAWKLTARGRKASLRWPGRDEVSREMNEMHSWEVTVARYERTGAPVIRPRSTPTELRVMIPGRWIPNEDGSRLLETGWEPIAAVDREETFHYYVEDIWAWQRLLPRWNGVWARQMLGR